MEYNEVGWSVSECSRDKCYIPVRVYDCKQYYQYHSSGTTHINTPGAIDSRNGISLLASMSQKRQKIISSDNTGRNEINERGHFAIDNGNW